MISFNVKNCLSLGLDRKINMIEEWPTKYFLFLVELFLTFGKIYVILSLNINLYKFSLSKFKMKIRF